MATRRRVVEQHEDWLNLADAEAPWFSLPVLKRVLPNGLDPTPPEVRAEHKARWYGHADISSARLAQDRSDYLDWLLRDVLAWRADYLTGGELPAELSAGGVTRHDVTIAPSGVYQPAACGSRRPVRRTGRSRTRPAPPPGAGRVCWCSLSPRGPTPAPARPATPGRRPGCSVQPSRVAITAYRWRWSPTETTSPWSTRHTAAPPAGGPGGRQSSPPSRSCWTRCDRCCIRGVSPAPPSATLPRRCSWSPPARRLRSPTSSAPRCARPPSSWSTPSRGPTGSGRGALLAGVEPHEVYEAAVTVMMRTVFLLVAEENDLLPVDNRHYQDLYAVRTLRESLQRERFENPEALENRTAAWHRLLATSRAVHGGVHHDELSVPAYGGDLFDPDRFAFLEGRTTDGTWHTTTGTPIAVTDLDVLAILEALLVLRFHSSGGVTDTRRLSYRHVDVEQIGHIYERLLDHDAVTAEHVVLGLRGKPGEEPEIALPDLETQKIDGNDCPRRLAHQQGR